MHNFHKSQKRQRDNPWTSKNKLMSLPVQKVKQQDQRLIELFDLWRNHTPHIVILLTQFTNLQGE